MTSRIHYDEHGWHVLDADGRVLGTFDAEADAKAFACSLRKATGLKMSLSSEIVKEAASEYAQALGGEWQLEDERFAEVRKMLRKAGEELEEAVLWRLQDDLHIHLADRVRRCAESAIEAVLNGNEAELRRWLSVDRGQYTGRERANSDVTHPVIHGKLFETGSLALRKQIVEAHPETLKSERILDLESQVESLVRQVNALTAQKDGMGRELAELRRLVNE